MALIDPMQSRVQRTVFNAIRSQLISMGYLPDRFSYPDTPLGDTQFEAAKVTVKTNKGFYVDIFGHSSARAKYKKECPRIVVFLHRVYEGEIGQAAGKIFTMTNTGTFNASLLPSLSSDLVFAIHLLSQSTQEDIVLNRAISQVFGQRKHIKFYDDSTKYMFITQTSYIDLDDPTENILERVYNYTVKDIVLAEDELLQTGIIPIQKITVDIDVKPDASDSIEVIYTP